MLRLIDEDNDDLELEVDLDEEEEDSLQFQTEEVQEVEIPEVTVFKKEEEVKHFFANLCKL